MKINGKQKEELKERLLENYDCYNNCLAEMIVDDFIDRIDEYDDDANLENMVDDITGIKDYSYTCSTYEEEEKCILIFNKNSKRVFMNRIIMQAGKEHYEPFCADVELLNAIVEFIKNM